MVFTGLSLRDGFQRAPVHEDFDDEGDHRRRRADGEEDEGAGHVALAQAFAGTAGALRRARTLRRPVLALPVLSQSGLHHLLDPAPRKGDDVPITAAQEIAKGKR